MLCELRFPASLMRSSKARGAPWPRVERWVMDGTRVARVVVTVLVGMWVGSESARRCRS